MVGPHYMAAYKKTNLCLSIYCNAQTKIRFADFHCQISACDNTNPPLCPILDELFLISSAYSRNHTNQPNCFPETPFLLLKLLRISPPLFSFVFRQFPPAMESCYTPLPANNENHFLVVRLCVLPNSCAFLKTEFQSDKELNP